jgi:hypothetical protein
VEVGWKSTIQQEMEKPTERRLSSFWFEHRLCSIRFNHSLVVQLEFATNLQVEKDSSLPFGLRENSIGAL